MYSSAGNQQPSLRNGISVQRARSIEFAAVNTLLIATPTFRGGEAGFVMTASTGCVMNVAGLSFRMRCRKARCMHGTARRMNGGGDDTTRSVTSGRRLSLGESEFRHESDHRCRSSPRCTPARVPGVFRLQRRQTHWGWRTARTGSASPALIPVA